MTILLTGARGFVGKSVLDLLADRGQPVRALAREAEVVERARAENPAVEWRLLPAADNSAGLSEVMHGVTCVIHLAARVHVMHDSAADPLAAFRSVNVAGTVALAHAAAAQGVRRFVFVSSIKVNGEKTSPLHPFTAEDDTAPQDPYAISKWEAEQALHRVAHETGLEVVIVRPPLVYGPGVKSNFAQMLKVVSTGIPLPLASVQNRRSLIYVGNLADALITCATHPAAVGQTYLVCDGEDVSTPDLLRQLAAAMGAPCRLLPCPPGLLRLAGKLTGKTQQLERLLGSLQVDGDKMRHDLNWVPPYSMQQGLQATAEWYRNRK